MDTLAVEIEEKVGSLIQQGDSFKEKSQYGEALKPYMAAYGALPDPKEDWDISILLFNKLGDCHFELQEYGAADYFYNQALSCDDGLGIAEAWLGIGKSRFELGDLKKAQEALLSAYMLAGKEVYTDKDNKYFEFLESSTPLAL
jgi:tetratricopeptide (TPR) repeat protein